MKLYVDTGPRLGLLQAQMAQGAIQRAEISYRGEVARRGTKLVTAAFAAGLLESRLAQNVNIVNAELLARERGIEISRTHPAEEGRLRHADPGRSRHRQEDLHRRRHALRQPISAAGAARAVPARHLLDGVMLIFTHRDVPGMIGYIGTIFGKHNVNIAQMTVGRQTAGGEAIGVLNLDQPPPEAALQEVRAHPQITSLSVVRCRRRE